MPGDLKEANSIAARAAAALWSHDGASAHMGMEIVSVLPRHAQVALTVTKIHLNGHGTVHGGILFALGDTAFAFACNSDGNTTVASHCSITFMRPAKVGDRLVATAQLVSLAGISGLYDIHILRGTDVVAEFRGYAKTIGGSFLNATEM